MFSLRMHLLVGLNLLGLVFGCIACQVDTRPTVGGTLPVGFQASSSAVAAQPEMRAVWIQSWSIASRERAEATLKRAEAGHFNAVFVNVFVYGQALYESHLLKKYDRVEPGFDPLAYLIEAGQQHQIAVHAWLVAGPVGGLNGPILSQHPDWAMMSLDGERLNWLNYNRPDVRNFIAEVAEEIVANYQVAGIHFDYTRYPHPGWKWGFDSYSTVLFAQEYKFDPNLLRYADLPAYGSFRGNPLTNATTAQVLAVFDDGQPAVLLNHYGDGEVILFNWKADERTIAAGSEIMRRSLNRFLDPTGTVYLLRSETNAERYGYTDFEKVATWLKELGWPPTSVFETEINGLPENGVLVLPSVYLIEAQTSTALADFVRSGGDVILIDGPTPSIKDERLQAIIGVRAQGQYINRTGLLIPVGQHPLIPVTEHLLEFDDYVEMGVKWKSFRKQGINRLLEEVHHRVKQKSPSTLVSITVTGSQEILAEKHFLEWSAWLEGGYVDLIIPRLYVKQGESLAPALALWQPVIDRSGRVMIGLNVFVSEDSQEAKTLGQLQTELDLARAAGSRGVIFFNLNGITDEFLTNLNW
ncbi:MAG: family 10 glycosylhydrolase [Anaerolineales bacterium]|nr:family 10 glycosylhydrolase [Anaerolineales bacterium]